MQFAKDFRQTGACVMGVQAAGIGEQPDLGLPELFFLGTDIDVWPTKRDAIGGDTENREHFGLVSTDLPSEGAAAALEFFLGEFIGSHGRSSDHVRDAVAQLEEFGVFTRLEDAGGKAAIVQGGPKSVSWAGEVVSRPGRVESRVDATEQDIQVVIDDIRDFPIDGGQEFLAAWQFSFSSSQQADNSI